MRNQYPVLCIARAVLESVTPLSVSTGSPDGVFDTALVRDANGIPAIPGMSLAGVLRHLWIDDVGPAAADELFGFQDGKSGQLSRVTVSWGSLLDSRGRPAEGLLLGSTAKRLEDPLYARTLMQIDAPVFRNRVRLTHRGAATATGKFDRAILPAGNRFAVELRLWTNRNGETEWSRLLDLFTHPGLRLGGATRAGLGRIRCVSLHQGRFDLGESDQANAYLKLGRGLTDIQGLNKCETSSQARDGWLTATLRLSASGFWRIGQGDEPLDIGNGKPADLLPVTEERIEWNRQGHGKTGLRALLLPAASLKGALVHRMAFHAHRFTNSWAVEECPSEPDKPKAVKILFGEVKDKALGKAGCLFMDDAFISVDVSTIQRLMHNAIDRFTGGVRDRMLFEEESVYGGTVSVPLMLDLKHLSQNEEDIEAVRRALSAALEDLCTGRLALGSRTTTGNGFFRGELTGPLADWLGGTRQDPHKEIATK